MVAKTGSENFAPPPTASTETASTTSSLAGSMKPNRALWAASKAARSLATAAPRSPPSPPNRNRLLSISITLNVPKSGEPDFGGGEGWDEGGAPRVRACGTPPSLRPSPPEAGEGADAPRRSPQFSEGG